jgi:hypothetical protein
MAALLQTALQAQTLDDAVRPIQDALGITDGGVAGNVFSGLPEGVDSWPTLSEDERRRWLGEWLRAEAMYS